MQPKVADAAIAGIAPEPAPVDAMGNVTGMASGGLPDELSLLTSLKSLRLEQCGLTKLPISLLY